MTRQYKMSNFERGQLYDSTKQEVKRGKCIGIVRTANDRNHTTIDARKELTRRTVHGL